MGPGHGFLRGLLNYYACGLALIDGDVQGGGVKVILAERRPLRMRTNENAGAPGSWRGCFGDETAHLHFLAQPPKT
eukprot:scaffold47819_cov13-Prasinocladus_malaysianus.AAC.1